MLVEVSVRSEDEDMTTTSLNFSQLNCDLPYGFYPPPFYSKPVRMLITSVLTLFLLVCVSGNLVLIAAISTSKLIKSRTNMFVTSLAVADLGVAVLVMPFGIYQQATNKKWLLGETTCLVATSLDVMLCTVSILHLSCLAVDRYLAICHPFYNESLTTRYSIVMIAVCWTAPLFISFLPLMNRWNTIGLEEMLQCAQMPKHTCVFVVNAEFAYVGSIIAFYIPTCFMCYCYWRIYLCARTQRLHIRRMSSSFMLQHQKKERKAAKTLGIVMGCFCVCWFPFFIFNVVDPLVRYKIPYVPWTVALWLGYVNSLMNPFLYYAFNRHYRNGFRKMLCHARERSSVTQLQTSVTYVLSQGPAHFLHRAASAQPHVRPRLRPVPRVGTKTT